MDPKIPDEEDESLDPKSSEVKDVDDAVFLLPSISSLKYLCVGEYRYILYNIYIYIYTTTVREKLFKEKKMVIKCICR